MTKFIFYSIFIALFIIILTGCAKIGTPSGGPTDNEPPGFLYSEPAINTTNFDEKSIEIYFDEFIRLDKINEELVVSPPMPEEPDVILKGESIKIDLIPDQLTSQTTYTLNFGNSIKDNNESNPLPGFEYVFSTGNYIDSLTLTGKVINAFDLSIPEEKCYVILHDTISDTSLYHNTPQYIGKVDEEGFFTIRHICHDTFMVFALVDNNSNLKYDLPSEKIAFLDTLISMDESYYVKQQVPDTSATQDTLSMNDTLITDTASAKQIAHRNDSVYDTIPDSTMTEPDSLSPFDKGLVLFLFKEKDTIFNQYVKDYKRPSEKKMIISFNNTLKDTLTIDPVNFSPQSGWLFIEENLSNDSLICWITDTSVIKLENIELSVGYEKLDSNGLFFTTYDTLSFRYTEKSKNRRKRRDKEDEKEKEEKLKINSNIAGTLDLNKEVELSFDQPIERMDTSLITLYEKEDTINKPVPYNIMPKKVYGIDTFNHKRLFVLTYEWKEKTDYNLFVAPNAMKDIFGTVNDSTNFSFKTKPMDYYGKIVLELKSVDTPLVVQLLDTKEKLVREQYATSDTTLAFSYLDPLEYILKLIIDENGNKKWDTGNYKLKKQPEAVSYYREATKVKSNWEIELIWDVGNVD